MRVTGYKCAHRVFPYIRPITQKKKSGVEEAKVTIPISAYMRGH